MKTLTLSLFILFFSVASNAQEKGSLTIKIPEIKKQKGSIVILLYNSPDGFPRDHEKAAFKYKYSEFDKSLEHTFTEVPYGTYSALVFHDVNDNGKMDRRRLVPMPKEPIGISMTDKLSRPDFEKASFQFNTSQQEITINFLND